MGLRSRRKSLFQSLKAMNNHQQYARWDVVRGPFPFTEGMGDKRRPALIVNGRKLARSHNLYWLVMITSVIKPAWTGDILISDLASAGLSIPSIIRTAKITT